MLLKEKDWYTSQELDEPFVKFFNNAHIVGMSWSILIYFNYSIIYWKSKTAFFLFILDVFDHKLKGIYPLLDDECEVRESNVQNFTSKLRDVLNNSLDGTNLNFPAINWLRQTDNSFIIRHFAGDVKYSTVKRIKHKFPYPYSPIFFHYLTYSTFQ